MTIENHSSPLPFGNSTWPLNIAIYSQFSLKQMWFSIVMLIYRRVTSTDYHSYRFLPPESWPFFRATGRQPPQGLQPAPAKPPPRAKYEISAEWLSRDKLSWGTPRLQMGISHCVQCGRCCCNDWVVKIMGNPWSKRRTMGIACILSLQFVSYVGLWLDDN